MFLIVELIKNGYFVKFGPDVQDNTGHILIQVRNVKPVDGRIKQVLYLHDPDFEPTEFTLEKIMQQLENL